MLTLARRTVRGRRRTFVSTFIILTMSVTVVTAAGVLIESGVRGGAAPDRYAGVPLVIAGQQERPDPEQDDERIRLPERVRVPVSVAEEVAAVPGVRKVVIDRSVPIAADAVGHEGTATLVGQGWSSAALWPLETVRGRPPRADDEVAVDVAWASDGEVAVGDTVRISTLDGVRSYSVVGLVAPSGRPVRRSLGVFFADDVARQLSVDPRHADALGVFVADGVDPGVIADQLRPRLDATLATLTGGARAGPESLHLAERNQQLVEFGGAFGTTAAMLAAFVVAATLGMTILQRGQELASLRTVGATPRQVRRLLVGEAALVAVLAALAGLGPGLLVGGALFGVLGSHGLVDATTALRVGPVPVLAASAVGLVTAAMAAWLAGRRVSRLDPTAALAESSVEPRRIGWFRALVGVVLVAGGLALSVLAGTLEGEQGASAVVGVLLTLLVGIAVLGPVLARGAGTLGAPLAALGAPASGTLAAINLRTRARRLASASTPLALAVAVTVTMVGTIRTAPGVASAAGVTTTSIGVERLEPFGETVFELRPAVGLSTSGIEGVLDLDVEAGSLSQLGRDDVAVSREIAWTAEVDVGDELSVWLGDGTPATLHVRAIYMRSLGLGDLIVTHATIAGHVTDPMIERILVATDGAADARAVDIALDDVADRTPGATVVDRASYLADRTQAAEEDTAINHLFVAVLALFVTAAMVNSLVLATGERTRELALLRLLGATPRQVRTMVRRETIVLAMYGSGLGVAVAALTLVPFSLGIAGTPLPAVPIGFLWGVVAGAILTATVATEIPTRLALRAEPTEVLTRTG